MIENASQMPKVFYCRHMQPGTARYENETILVDGAGMHNLIGSATKRSVPIYVNHQDVDLKNIKEQAAGYTGESFYNELDGWAWFKMIVVGDEGIDAIKKGWAVSNAYVPSEWGPGGTKNNVPYHREVRNGEFTHLAIVPDPRYEGACIMSPDEFKNYQDTQRKKLAELKNAKEKKPMFKLFKTTREEVTNAADATEVQLENGKIVSIEEMINALTKPEAKKFKVGDKEMTAEEIKNAYEMLQNSGKPKKNSETKMKEDPDEVDAEGDQDEEGDDEIGTDKKNKKNMKNKKGMKNSDEKEEEEDCRNADDEDEGMDMKNKKAKKNSKSDLLEVDIDDKHFEEMRNAHLNPKKHNAQPELIRTSLDGIALGKARY